MNKAIRMIRKEAGLGTGLVNLGKNIVNATKGVYGSRAGAKAAGKIPEASYKRALSGVIAQHAKTNPMTSRALRYGGTAAAAVGADRLLFGRGNKQNA